MPKLVYRCSCCKLVIEPPVVRTEVNGLNVCSVCPTWGVARGPADEKRLMDEVFDGYFGRSSLRIDVKKPVLKLVSSGEMHRVSKQLYVVGYHVGNETVYALDGLPYTFTVGVVAHELMHIWFSRYGRPKDIWDEEGYCELQRGIAMARSVSAVGREMPLEWRRRTTKMIHGIAYNEVETYERAYDKIVGMYSKRNGYTFVTEWLTVNEQAEDVLVEIGCPRNTAAATCKNNVTMTTLRPLPKEVKPNM